VTRNRREFSPTHAADSERWPLPPCFNRKSFARQRSIPWLPSRRNEAKAKSVVFFPAGGPSHMDTFDPKPLLNKLNGEKRPASFGEVKYQFVNNESRLLGTKRTFKRYGKSGIEVSDLFPNLAQCIDDIAVIRSCHGDMVVHSAAQYQLFTGRVIPGFPSMGSWVIYGLGSEAESLPAYVVMR
jgi:hypothetical protein